MPRKARINNPGLTHHVMARTFHDLLLFNDTTDRKFYLSCLSRRIHETGFICYAWVLMDNHVHLLIRTTELPLWKLMKPLNSEYAHYYNKKYHRRGPLFSDRYKSIATQDQVYLEQLIRYIHLNPIRAGICKTIHQLDHYPWSGHRVIVEKDNNSFQDIKQVFKRFGKTPELAIKKYREFISEGLKIDSSDDVTRDVRLSNEGKSDKYDSGCWVIGDAEFQKTVLEKDFNNRIALARYKREGISLEDVLKGTARLTAIAPELLMGKSKRTPQAQARKIFCYFAREFGFPTIDTGNFLGIQQAAVSNAARSGAEIAKQAGLIWKNDGQ